MGRPKYFTPAEVAAHNTAADLWVSLLGKVCDLTPLMDQYKGDALLLPIMECAGKDISFWFDPETKDVQKHVDPLTNCVRYYTPRGRFVHIPPAGPRSDWASAIGPPWWRDKTYEVGLLTSKTRWIRIINTLTSQEQLLEFKVQSSDTRTSSRLWFVENSVSNLTESLSSAQRLAT
ncbi:Cytochrome b5 domain-containing protein 1, partial [Larimichthys crocea]